MSLKEEFTWNKFGLKHYSLVDLCICWFQSTGRITPAWIGYRFIVLVYFFASFSACCVIWLVTAEPEDKPKFFVFLTNWTYFLETIVFLLGFILAAMEYVNQYYGTLNNRVLNLGKAFWVLYTVALPCSVMVTLAFWIYLKGKIDACSVILHASNSGIMVFDFCLVAFPIRFLHFYMPVAYLILYSLFYLTYEHAGGRGPRGQRPIYRGLDWIENPTRAFVLFGLLICSAVFVHAFFSLLSVVKLWLRKEIVLDN